MARVDPHSYTDDQHPQVTSLSWEARVDFASRTLHATVTLHLATAGSGPLDLDTRDLDVSSVVDAEGRAVPFVLHPEEPVLGARLSLELASPTPSVTIAYRTSADASALQWLDGAQTAGGTHPFLFSQCQAIHARSVLPLQDTPQRRITFRASLDVPAALRGLKLPVVVLHGADDPLLMPVGGEATAAAIPGAELRIIPGMGHDLPPGLYDIFIDAITTAAQRARITA